MDDQIFIVRWGDSLVDIGRPSFIASDILNAIEQLKGNGSGEHTERETWNIALISDDFPIPDYQRISMRWIFAEGNKPYPANDKDPEPAIQISWIIDILNQRYLGHSFSIGPVVGNSVASGNGDEVRGKFMLGGKDI